jgi:hypothetical protein
VRVRVKVAVGELVWLGVGVNVKVDVASSVCVADAVGVGSIGVQILKTTIATSRTIPITIPATIRTGRFLNVDRVGFHPILSDGDI